MEYCSRGELFDFLMYTGRLGERATRTYFHQFLNGLNAMHKSGYAHRDLKPENLLLSDDFTLKVLYFICLIFLFVCILVFDLFDLFNQFSFFRCSALF